MNRFRMTSVIAVLAISVGFASVSPVAAAGTGPTEGGAKTRSQAVGNRVIAPAHPGNVECPKGKMVVDVTQQVANDLAYQSFYLDMVNGNTFAMQGFNKHIKAWQIGSDTFGQLYCAEVTYEGSFVTIASTSPANALIPISAGIKGDLKGRYVTTNFHGTLNPSPAWKTKGNLGKVDWACDPITFVCPGYVNWLEVYFNPTPADWDYATHDFTYSAHKHGTFIQHLLTFEGNITN